MKVRYGKHTYASKNQKEYDAVMKIIDTAYPEVCERIIWWGDKIRAIL